MSADIDTDKLLSLVNSAKRILIMQADNPDGDSLGSALALEEILGDLGKDTYLYCGVDMPSYLRYLEGWGRVQKTLPSDFDLSIIVDCSAESLFDTLNKSPQKSLVEKKPSIIIDHHDVEVSISYSTLVIFQPVVAAAQLIYEIARKLNWHINPAASEALLVGIMSDSLGLTTEATSARSIEIVSELVSSGISIAKVETRRRDLSRKSPELQKYKGVLLQRAEYYDDDRVAVISIPWSEIERYSNVYNPSMLVIDDLRQTIGTQVVIAFKIYSDNHVTAKIRCNYGYPIAKQLAENFGGGGHKYASGFRIDNGTPFDEVKIEAIQLASEILENLDQRDENI